MTSRRRKTTTTGKRRKTGVFCFASPALQTSKNGSQNSCFPHSGKYCKEETKQTRYSMHSASARWVSLHASSLTVSEDGDMAVWTPLSARFHICFSRATFVPPTVPRTVPRVAPRAILPKVLHSFLGVPGGTAVSGASCFLPLLPTFLLTLLLVILVVITTMPLRRAGRLSLFYRFVFVLSVTVGWGG